MRIHAAKTLARGRCQNPSQGTLRGSSTRVHKPMPDRHTFGYIQEKVGEGSCEQRNRDATKGKLHKTLPHVH
jgi:hypothetical protein